MANYNDDFVDISSNDDVNKVYETDKRREQPKKKKNKGLGRRIFVLVLSLIMLLVGSGLVYYYKVLDSMTFKELEPEPVAATTTTSETTTYSIASGGSTLLSSDNVLNILLFGQDSPATEEDHGRSDTTILLSIDNVNKKLKLTSFQRDTYVSIPGHGDNKINSAFTFGGERLSIDTIETNFGIKVDKYATVDFSSFRDIIEALGGVDIELTLEEIKYINAQIDVNDQLDVTNFLTYDETKEKQMVHLDGYQALWYARDRGEESLGGNPEYSFSGDDWDRTSRQRNLIETIIKNLRENASLTELVAIANRIGPLVTTNLKKGDITFLVSNMLTYINYDMEEMSLPTQDRWQYGTTSDGQSVIAITDWDGVRSDVAKFIYEDSVSGGSTSSSSSTTAPTTAAVQ
ncbi:MAG: LCP family protein [Ruminococcus sp.]|uniref:LCP family protein n=1 Tax=Ruminococcus sp. TaxID=41978 RepID=UPI00287331DF|nr:LCP family protein [Ruminococcus sp.]MBQ3284137.1 LCP family protein [Ruminococcus sp.]